MHWPSEHQLFLRIKAEQLIEPETSHTCQTPGPSKGITIQGSTAQNTYGCACLLHGVISDHRQWPKLVVSFNYFSFCVNCCWSLRVTFMSCWYRLAGWSKQPFFIFFRWWLRNNKAQWCYSQIEQGCSPLPFVQSYLCGRLLASHLKHSPPRALSLSRRTLIEKLTK